MDDFGIDMDPEPGSSVMGQRIEDEYNFEVLYRGWGHSSLGMKQLCISQVLSTEEIVSNMVDSIKEVTPGTCTAN